MAKTKISRIVIASLLMLLSWVSAFLGGGVAGLTIYVVEFGTREPEMFGWLGSLIILGIPPLVTAAPAIVIMTALFFIWSLPAGRHALLSIALSPVLGSLAYIVLYMCSRSGIGLSLYAYLISGTVCLVVGCCVEILLKARLQRQVNQMGQQDLDL